MIRKNTRKFSRQNLLILLGVFVAVALFSFLVQTVKKPVDAANLNNFDAGYIISDYQMRNYTSMSEAEIQAFLKSKNSCNDTNLNKGSLSPRGYVDAGTKYGVKYNYRMTFDLGNGNGPTTYYYHVENGHFVCMADESFNGESAAHIIWQAARDYKINPQVLIVLLQKEQGLVTDTWPNSGAQYRSATGYGCPDTAPCSSEYYGFKNQVRKAAEMFNTVLNGGWTNYPLGWNYIQYSPNDCGGSWVNVRNLATSALYRYTPYQPNAGALAAGYGTAYCGAYGNRNFYAYFEDWFGGITSTKITWENMSSPRIMTVNKPTLIIDVKSHDTTGIWLGKDENYYFTKKTSVFWGNQNQTCLQRKIDEGTDRCVLLARLSDFSLEKNITKIPVNEYEVITWTCIVDFMHQSAECGKKSYAKGSVLKFNRQIRIDGKDYLIEVGRNDNFAVLKARTKLKISYENIGPTTMGVLRNTYKYIAGENTKVQTISTSEYQTVTIMQQTTINNKKFYRTLHDYNKKNDYLIPAEDLVDAKFTNFLIPRNMVANKDTNSINVKTKEVCKNYKSGDIKRYVHKTVYAGVTYYQNESESNTLCGIKSSDLSETKYNFNNKNVKNSFAPFLYPRKLKIKNGGYSINLENGNTCDEYLKAGDVQKYTTKFYINGMAFYRTEKNTSNNSSCAVPSTNLIEIN